MFPVGPIVPVDPVVPVEPVGPCWPAVNDVIIMREPFAPKTTPAAEAYTTILID